MSLQPSGPLSDSAQQLRLPDPRTLIVPEPELLPSLEIPQELSSRVSARRTFKAIHDGVLAFGQSPLEELLKINGSLGSSLVRSWVTAGKVTVGLIKPHATAGRNLPYSDDEAAAVLVEAVGPENILFSMPVVFSREEAVRFYAPLQAQYSQIPHEMSGSVWDSIINFMTSGPITAVLIYREQGDAVAWWRERMGATRPEKADPESIRGRYALHDSLPNNLTHGSDSVESVNRELGVIVASLQNLGARAIANAQVFPTEKMLKDLGVIPSAAKLDTIERIFEDGPSSESWIYAFRINFRDEAGTIQRCLLKEKNLISIGGGNGERAVEQEERARTLEAIGIKIPRLYGCRSAALYSEFIQENGLAALVDKIRTAADVAEVQEPLNQLIDYAARLDQAGFETRNFVADLVFDKATGELYYTDYGSDLGAPSGSPSTLSLRCLVSRFPQFQEHIYTAYTRKRLELVAGR